MVVCEGDVFCTLVISGSASSYVNARVMSCARGAIVGDGVSVNADLTSATPDPVLKVSVNVVVGNVE